MKDKLNAFIIVFRPITNRNGVRGAKDQVSVD